MPVLYSFERAPLTDFERSTRGFDIGIGQRAKLQGFACGVHKVVEGPDVLEPAFDLCCRKLQRPATRKRNRALGWAIAIGFTADRALCRSLESREPLRVRGEAARSGQAGSSSR